MPVLFRDASHVHVVIVDYLLELFMFLNELNHRFTVLTPGGKDSRTLFLILIQCVKFLF